jgi:hypothetical protein
MPEHIDPDHIATIAAPLDDPDGEDLRLTVAVNRDDADEIVLTADLPADPDAAIAAADALLTHYGWTFLVGWTADGDAWVAELEMHRQLRYTRVDIYTIADTDIVVARLRHAEELRVRMTGDSYEVWKETKDGCWYTEIGGVVEGPYPTEGALLEATFLNPSGF